LAAFEVTPEDTKYNRISDLIPAFISVCEAQSANQQGS